MYRVFARASGFSSRRHVGRESTTATGGEVGGTFPVGTARGSDAPPRTELGTGPTTMNPLSDFLVQVLDRAGFAHELHAESARATFRYGPPEDVEGLLVEVSVRPRVLRFDAWGALPEAPLDPLHQMSRDWRLGCAHLDPRDSTVHTVIGLYVGSGFPPPPVVHLVTDHLYQGTVALRRGLVPGLRPPPDPRRPSLQELANAFTAGSAQLEPGKDHFLFRGSPPSGPELVFQVDVLDDFLLQLRAYPVGTPPWPEDVGIRHAQAVAPSLDFGTIVWEQGHLMWRAAVVLDWAAVDGELVHFLLASAAQVAPHLVNQT